MIFRIEKGWAGHVTRNGEKQMHTDFWCRIPCKAFTWNIEGGGKQGHLEKYTVRLRGE
jgi:hypothetical protein